MEECPICGGAWKEGMCRDCGYPKIKIRYARHKATYDGENIVLNGTDIHVDGKINRSELE